MTTPTTYTVLAGHTSAETAYLIEDYPYGFRLRCQMRVWIETKRGHGQRFVSQTSNPKRPGTWNKPKASTYKPIVVLYADAAGHVHHVGLGCYDDIEGIDAFEEAFAPALAGHYEREMLRYLRAARRAATRVSYVICTTGPDGRTRHDEHCPNTCERMGQAEQARVMGALIRRELWQDTLDAIHAG